MAAFTLIVVDLSRDFQISWSLLSVGVWAILLAANACVFVLLRKLSRSNRVSLGSRPRLRRSD